MDQPQQLGLRRRRLPHRSQQPGLNVADAVGGGATIALDLPRNQRFETFGYPGNVSRMQGCNSTYRGDDRLSYPFPGPPTLGIGCHWAPGASGGGWLIDGGTQINGLNSYLTWATAAAPTAPTSPRKPSASWSQGSEELLAKRSRRRAGAR